MVKYLLSSVVAMILVGAACSILAAQPASAEPTTQPAATVDTKPVNTKCPVTGEDIDPAVTAVYNGKTYAFCCADCVTAFKKNPEKYADKIK